ncbi:MAG: DUF3570 domain-containing protein [Myxococcales bacterium]|nr:DUF3570 domain-containing protein [Myxococcales bacterium]
MLLCLGRPAWAEHLPQNVSGEAVFRGSYWRDRNTRVINPTVDIRQQTASGFAVTGSYGLDAITSASVAAGATSDEPFTELRHEVGFGTEIPLVGKSTVSAGYGYSSESDYFSHTASLRAKVSLFQENTILRVGGDYTHSSVGKRLGPTGYLNMGILHEGHAIAGWTQVLGRSLIASLTYELFVLSGYQNNPYRPVSVAGERREFENLPTSRIRHAFALSSHKLFGLPGALIPFVVLRPALRVFTDSWGVSSVSPEVALHLPIGPFELRGLLGYFRQWEASFYRSNCGEQPRVFPGSPCYAERGVEFGQTTDAMGRTSPFLAYTSDPKLGSYSTLTTELQIKWRMTVFSRLGPVGEHLSRSVIELSGGLWFAQDAVGNQFGIPFVANEEVGVAGCAAFCGAGFAHLGLYVPL